jgi:hypothetical protein
MVGKEESTEMNRSRRVGTHAEEAVAQYLRDEGFGAAETRRQHGTKDQGDIAGLPEAIVEVKAEKSFDISGYLREAAVEKTNAGAEVGVVWLKLPRKGQPKDWAVIMTGETFVPFLTAWMSGRNGNGKG